MGQYAAGEECGGRCRVKKKVEWDEVEQLAYEMGLRPVDYASMSMRQFTNAVAGYWKGRSRDMEHTRAICYYIAAANRDPKKPFPSTMQKFWPLPTDEHTERVISEDRKKKIMALYDKAKEWQVYNTN